MIKKSITINKYLSNFIQLCRISIKNKYFYILFIYLIAVNVIISLYTYLLLGRNLYFNNINLFKISWFAYLILIIIYFIIDVKYMFSISELFIYSEKKLLSNLFIGII